MVPLAEPYGNLLIERNYQKLVEDPTGDFVTGILLYLAYYQSLGWE